MERAYRRHPAFHAAVYEPGSETPKLQFLNYSRSTNSISSWLSLVRNAIRPGQASAVNSTKAYKGNAAAKRNPTNPQRYHQLMSVGPQRPVPFLTPFIHSPTSGGMVISWSFYGRHEVGLDTTNVSNLQLTAPRRELRRAMSFVHHRSFSPKCYAALRPRQCGKGVGRSERCTWFHGPSDQHRSNLTDLSFAGLGGRSPLGQLDDVPNRKRNGQKL